MSCLPRGGAQWRGAEGKGAGGVSQKLSWLTEMCSDHQVYITPWAMTGPSAASDLASAEVYTFAAPSRGWSPRAEADEVASSSLFGPASGQVQHQSASNKSDPPSPSTPFLFGERSHSTRPAMPGGAGGSGLGGSVGGDGSGAARQSPNQLGNLRGAQPHLNRLEYAIASGLASQGYPNQHIGQNQLWPAGSDSPGLHPAFSPAPQRVHPLFASQAPSSAPPTSAACFPSFPQPQLHQTGTWHADGGGGVRPSLMSSLSADAGGYPYIGHHNSTQSYSLSPATTPIASEFASNPIYSQQPGMITPTTAVIPRSPPGAPYLPNDWSSLAHPPAWAGAVYDGVSSPTRRYRALSSESLFSSGESPSPFFSPASVSSSPYESPYVARPPLLGPSASFPHEYNRPRANTVGFSPAATSAYAGGHRHQQTHSVEIQRPHMLAGVARQLSYQGPGATSVQLAAQPASSSGSLLAPMLTAHKAGASSRPSTSSSAATGSPPPFLPAFGSPYAFSSGFPPAQMESPRSALLPRLSALGLQSPQGSALPLPDGFSPEPSGRSSTSPISPGAFGPPLAWPGRVGMEMAEYEMVDEAQVKAEDRSDGGLVGAAGGWDAQAWDGRDPDQAEASTSQAHDGDRKISPITGKPT